MEDDAGDARRRRFAFTATARPDQRPAGDQSRRHRRARRNPGRRKLRLKSGEAQAKGHIALPMEVRNATTRIAVAGEDSAERGAIAGHRARPSAQRRHRFRKPRAKASRCWPTSITLEQALSPSAEISKGTDLGAAEQEDYRCLVLADVARIAGADLKQVQDSSPTGGVGDPLCRRARHQWHRQYGAECACASASAIWAAPLAWASPQRLCEFTTDQPVQRLGHSRRSHRHAPGVGRTVCRK